MPSSRASVALVIAAVCAARVASAQVSPADVHFMTGMIHHHAQAVLMAKWAPTHGARPELQRLAERILVGQSDEIVLMRGWLLDRGAPVPEPTPGPMRMQVDGMDHMMLMPGMLTDAQLAGLDSARGAAFDRLFLTLMIQHHAGAIEMVRTLFASPGAGQDPLVFRFASDVVADQTAEIARMRSLLDASPDHRR
jgi:uncharacterized protein (DUF305 family)